MAVAGEGERDARPIPREAPVTSEVAISRTLGATGRAAARDYAAATMRRLLIPAALLIAMLVTALPAQAATVRVQRFSGFQDVRVTGASQTRYRLRLAYTVPGTWPVRGRASGLTRTFGPIGSCRFTVRVSCPRRGRRERDRGRARRPSAAGDRAAPARRRDPLERGVAGGAPDGRAGGDRPARPSRAEREDPARGGRVWLEVRFSATPDPRTECHAGGPRTVGAQTGDALATAGVGGFSL